MKRASELRSKRWVLRELDRLCERRSASTAAASLRKSAR
jgi:hypothetical protein